MIGGVDISLVQGEMTPAQWDALEASTGFVIGKCGNGNDGVDGDWAAFVAAVTGRAFRRGAYHFPFPLPADELPAHAGRAPEDQARAHFAACGGMGSNKGELPATLDCEYPRPEQWDKPIPGVGNSIVSRLFLLDWYERYFATYEALQGRPMIVYGDPWFLKCLAPPASWAARPLWEAAYGTTAPAVAPWAGWSLRQTAGGTSQRLPNGAPVDSDVCVDQATLDALCGLP